MLPRIPRIQHRIILNENPDLVHRLKSEEISPIVHSNHRDPRHEIGIVHYNRIQLVLYLDPIQDLEKYERDVLDPDLEIEPPGKPDLRIHVLDPQNHGVPLDPDTDRVLGLNLHPIGSTPNTEEAVYTVYAHQVQEGTV